MDVLTKFVKSLSYTLQPCISNDVLLPPAVLLENYFKGLIVGSTF